AIDMGKKLEGFIKRNPKKWGLIKGGIGGLGAIAGGWLGTKIAQSLMGDLKDIAVPETEETLAEFGFEKGFTYEVTVKKGHNGEPTYLYKKMDSQELSSIDKEKRLDSDSCEKELVKLSDELIKRLKQLEEENQAS
ncbi:hypothetical protein KKB11_00105, partial [Candidatus Micrarchaeota archaeon]|nr:hypothetical protein [Candidatus Micrarchaeota archaeon]